MREILLDRLKQDLIGPYSEDEVLTSRPSDVYLTGILWPRESRMGAEEDERFGLSGAGENETDGGGEEEEISLVGMSRPCSAGVSFAARTAEDSAEVDVFVQFATYEPEILTKAETDPESENDQSENGGSVRRRTEWRRKAYDIPVDGIALQSGARFKDLEPEGAPPGVRLHLRSTAWSGGTLATITLLNQAEPDEEEGREGIERLTLFQIRIEIRPRQGTVLVARPSRRAILDDDDRSGALLYRNAHEFANGHTCSVEWEPGLEPATARSVATTWTPTTTVHATSSAGHEVFASLRKFEKHRPLVRPMAGDCHIR